MTASEKIRIILLRNHLTMVDLGDRTRQSKQNINKKLSRGDLKESDIYKYAEALGYSAEVIFTAKDGTSV